MGADLSTVPEQTMSQGVAALERLCSPEHISLKDAFWCEEVECLQFELDDYDPREIETLIQGLCAKMARNNVRSRNLNTMMRVLMQRIKVIGRKITQTGSITEDESVALLNLLFLTRLFLKHLIEDQTYDQLVLHFVEHGREAHSKNQGEVSISVDDSDSKNPAPPHSPPQTPPSILANGSPADSEMTLPVEFMRSIVNAILDFEVYDATYEIHVEFMATLLVACSTQIYEPLEPETRNIFLEAAMHDSVTGRAQEFVQALVQRFIDRPSVGGVYSPESRQSVLQKVGGAVLSLITLPLKIYQYFFPPPSKEHPLADHAALVLLVITHQRLYVPVDDASSHTDQEDEIEDVDDHVSLANPYQNALENFEDSSVFATTTGKSNKKGIDIDFSMLYDAVAACVNFEGEIALRHYTRKWGTILLYSFLHGNSKFRDYLFSRSDVDVIVLPLLEKLYFEKDLSSNSTYMVLIILLILSQDPSFCEIIHERLILDQVTWFRDAILHNISLGSLTMAVLLRTVSSNLASIRDPYLLHNCLASLSNMSSYASNVHPHAAQRLIYILKTLIKRYLKLLDRANVKIRPFNSEPIQPSSTHTHHRNESSNSTNQPDFAQPQRHQSVPLDLDASQTSSPTHLPVQDGMPIEIQSVSPCNASNFSYSTETDSDSKLEESAEDGIDDDAATFSDFIRLILEITNSTLRPKLVPSNTSLIYVLLHGREILKPLRKHGQFWDLVQSLDHIINYFDFALRQANLTDLSVDSVLMVFNDQARNYETTQFARNREVILQPQFTYEERSNSSEFFLPYIWSVIFSCAGILWSPDNIVLFTPQHYEDEAELFPELAENEENIHQQRSSNSSTGKSKDYVQEITTNPNGEVEISVELP